MSARKIHLHRYGGHVMCGKPIGEVEHTDDDLTFNAHPDACKTCEKAKTADDDRLFVEESWADDEDAPASSGRGP